MAQLICNNLSLGYDTKTILSDISFSVEKGDYLCIVGDNGSGKTTLMKAILGIVSPIRGTIFYGDGIKKSEIGYLPQQTTLQKDFPASVWEIVLSGCHTKRGVSFFLSKAKKERAEYMLKKVGISHLKKSCYMELSGGQQQKVLLCRALCATEKALLLDEPVTGLDPAATVEFYSLIEKLNKEENITIIMISHDISAARKYADHILNLGKEVFFGTKEEYCLKYPVICSCGKKESEH